MDREYEVQFLPIARQDMIDIARYIGQELSNPSAATRLAEAMIKAAEGLSVSPYANPVLHPIRPLQHEYRKLFVRNYIMFYWVDEEKRIITVSRVIYAKRNYKADLD